ncbi:MAG TPA: lysophospholipid acyltransferase family protein [Luteitalea sp.]|nr:lysophospholipid acyltransferase family protein [Luteitalea sp.]
MSDRPAWEQSASKRRQVALIAGVGAPIIGALGRTWRFTSEGAEAYDRILAAGQRPIMAFWHGRILPATVFWRDRGIVVITSENFDGEWIARIITRFGYGQARGSSSRGGVKALVQLKRLMQQGHATAFTLDGPRGPAEHAQPGAVWLAKATGQPILPFHVEAASAWHARSWDRTQVPRPFSRVAVAVGAPFLVANDLDEAGLERRRVDLEAELARLRERALALLTTTGHS